MPSNDDPDLSVASALRDLDALRKRLDQAPTWLKDGETAVSVTALAQEVRCLCRQASGAGDPRTARKFLAEAMKFIQDLEVLLGLH